MVGNVVGHEARHEIVAVIVAGLVAERERDAGRAECLLEQVGLELLLEEIIRRTLVDQDLGGPIGGARKFRGVVLAPSVAVVAKIARENAFSPQGQRMGAEIGANAESER